MNNNRKIIHELSSMVVITSIFSLFLPLQTQAQTTLISNNNQLIWRQKNTPPSQNKGFAAKEGSSTQEISTQDCQVQNDGSTWCNYNIDGNLKWACYSDWDGGYCNGDEKDDNKPGPN